MKRLVVFALLIIFSTVSVFANAEQVAIYRQLFNNAPSRLIQLELLREMAEINLTGAGELYAEILRGLVTTYGNITDATERAAAAEQIVILSELLGAERFTAAASDLWRAVEITRMDHQAAAMAQTLIALGMIQATEYLPRVIRILNDLNVAPPADRLFGERVAFGAIISLEQFQNPAGFVPVFLASQGWYSRRVTDQARASLAAISADPVPYLIEIIRGTGLAPSAQHAALRFIEEFDTSEANKALAASEALARGWEVIASPQTQAELSGMRIRALRMLGRYRLGDDTSVYRWIEQSYSGRGSSMQERFFAIAAFGFQGDDGAVEMLSRFLTNLNERNNSSHGHLGRDEEQLLRAIVGALGNSGNPNARPALNLIAQGNYVPATQRMAREQLQRISQ